MAYRVLALTIAAAVSLASATLAKEHCPVGQVYFRSKHTCVGKRTAIASKIYGFVTLPNRARSNSAGTSGSRRGNDFVPCLHR